MEQNRKRQTFDQAYEKATEHQQKKWERAIEGARDTIIKNAQKSGEDKEQARKDWDELDAYEDYMEKFSQRDNDKEYSMPDQDNPKIDEKHLVNFINTNKTLEGLRHKMDKINSLKKVDTTGMHRQELKAHYRDIAERERQFSESSSRILNTLTGDNYRYASQAIDYLWSLGYSDSEATDADSANTSVDADPAASNKPLDEAAPADKDVDDSADNKAEIAKDDRETFKDERSRSKKIGGWLNKSFKKLKKLLAVSAAFTAVGAGIHHSNIFDNIRSAIEYNQSTGDNDVLKLALNQNAVEAAESRSAEAIGYASVPGHSGVGDRGVNKDETTSPAVVEKSNKSQESIISKEGRLLDELFGYVDQTPGYDHGRDTFFADADHKTDENNFAKPLETANRTAEEVRDDLAGSIIDSPDMIAQFLLGDEASEEQMNQYADLLKNDSAAFQKARYQVLNFFKNARIDIVEKTETFDTWWGEVVDGDVVMHRQIDDVKNDQYKNMVKIIAREVVNGQERVIEREYDTECRNLIKTKTRENVVVPPGGYETPPPVSETPPTPETPPAPETPPELEKKDPSQDLNSNQNLDREGRKDNLVDVNTNIGNVEDQQHVVPETYVAPAPPPVEFSSVAGGQDWQQVEQQFKESLEQVGPAEQGVNPSGNTQNNGRVE